MNPAELQSSKAIPMLIAWQLAAPNRRWRMFGRKKSIMIEIEVGKSGKREGSTESLHLFRHVESVQLLSGDPVSLLEHKIEKAFVSVEEKIAAISDTLG